MTSDVESIIKRIEEPLFFSVAPAGLLQWTVCAEDEEGVKRPVVKAFSLRKARRIADAMQHAHREGVKHGFFRGKRCFVVRVRDMREGGRDA